jgi:hypothetical protein
LHIAKQEVGEGITGCDYCASLYTVGALGIGTGEPCRGTVDITPCGGVVLKYQVLATEVKNVVTTDHGYYVGGIEVMFLVNGGGSG